MILQANQQIVWLPDQILKAYQAAKDAGREHLLIFVERTTGYEYRLLPVE